MNDKTPEQTSPAVTDSEASRMNDNLSQQGRQPTSPAPRSSVSKTALLSLLLSLGMLTMLAGAGWYTYRNIWPVLMAGPLANQTWVEQQLEDNSQTLSRTLEHNTTLIGQEIQSVSDQSGRLVARLDNLDRRLIRLQGADRNDWKLAEAEYLMRLANQRLLTMHDIKSAHTLLAQADELLVAVDEYGLFSVRQALAEDIAALRATPSIDISHAWMELNALAGRIEQLPVIAETLTINSQPSATVEEPKPVSPPAEPASVPGGNTILEKVAAQLTDLGEEASEGAQEIGRIFIGQFRIRENKIGHTPALLPPRQEVYLRQNLRLMLEQAQVALLQGRTTVYQSSLAKTQQWLKRWFLNDSPEMIALQKSLARLSRISAEQPVPDISRSLTALKAYINDKIDQTLPVEAVGTGEGQS